MAWEENSRICLHMQLIAILSRIGVTTARCPCWSPRLPCSCSPLAALVLYVNRSTINAIILLILRSFQRKGLCDSSLKAKSTTFVNNIKTEYNGRKQYNSR